MPLRSRSYTLEPPPEIEPCPPPPRDTPASHLMHGNASGYNPLPLGMLPTLPEHNSAAGLAQSQGPYSAKATDDVLDGNHPCSMSMVGGYLGEATGATDIKGLDAPAVANKKSFVLGSRAFDVATVKAPAPYTAASSGSRNHAVDTAPASGFMLDEDVTITGNIASPRKPAVISLQPRIAPDLAATTYKTMEQVLAASSTERRDDRNPAIDLQAAPCPAELFVRGAKVATAAAAAALDAATTASRAKLTAAVSMTAAMLAGEKALCGPATCWHEVLAIPVPDPVTDSKALLLMHSDVTQRVDMEKK